jgi:hypothetical protein
MDGWIIDFVWLGLYIGKETASRLFTPSQEDLDLLAEENDIALSTTGAGPLRYLNVGGTTYVISVRVLGNFAVSFSFFCVFIECSHFSIGVVRMGVVIGQIPSSRLYKWVSGVCGTDVNSKCVEEWKREGVVTRDGVFYLDRDGTFTLLMYFPPFFLLRDEEF